MPYDRLMTVRKTARIEVRVSEEDRRFLEDRLRECGQSISGWVQQQIEEEREAVALARRLAAVERIGAMNTEWIPENPEELTRMMNEAYDEDLADLIAIA